MPKVLLFIWAFVAALLRKREPKPRPEDSPPAHDEAQEIPAQQVSAEPALVIEQEPVIKRKPWRKVGKVEWNRPPRPKRAKKEPKEPKEPKAASREIITIERQWNDPEETGLIDLDSQGLEELYGRFYFRDTILEQLGTYFIYLQRMKRADRAAYDLFSRLGAHVAPYGFRIFKEDDKSPLGKDEIFRELTPWWKQNRPAFGAIVYAADPLGEKREKEESNKSEGWSLWVAKFLYFHKYARPPLEFQAAPGEDVYKMTIYWDRPDRKRKSGAPQDYAISIDRDGNVRVLRILCEEDVNIQCRRGWYRHSIQSFSRQTWKIPEDYVAQAKALHLGVKTFLRHIFIDAACRYERAQWGMIRVEASKEGLSAAFSIDAARLPYFFQDRDAGQSGSRAKIFHIVRAHQRMTKRGPVIVKMSFRGERAFRWNGYNILVTIPGKHHISLADYTVGAVDIRQAAPDERLLETEAIAEALKEHVHGADLKTAMAAKKVRLAGSLPGWGDVRPPANSAGS